MPTEIAECAARLDIDGLKKLLKNATDINKGYLYNGALAYTIYNNSYIWNRVPAYWLKYPDDMYNRLTKFNRIMDMLLEAGANPTYGMDMAARYGNVELVEFLIDRGANFNYASGNYGPWERAAREAGNYGVAQFFIDFKTIENGKCPRYIKSAL